MTKGVRLLATACVLLVGLALVLACGGAGEVAEGPADDFQRAVGGLGLGPAVDLSRCAAVFDARLQPCCSLRHGPIPGASLFCPAHASLR